MLLRSSALTLSALTLLHLSGCAQDRQEQATDTVPAAQDDNVLARVGDGTITVEDLYRFTAEMPAVLRSEEEGAEAVRDYLQSMIDKQLMLREAHSLNLGQDPEFAEGWNRERRVKLGQEYLKRNFRADADEKDVEKWRERFEKSKWSRMLRLAHIRTGTLETAQGIVRELDRGRVFAEAAREHSTAENTAAEGGLIDILFGRANLEDLGLPLAIAEEVFELPVGEISRPLRIADSYEIFTVVEEQPAPDYYLKVFVRVEFERKFLAWRDELLVKLASDFGVQVEPAAVEVLIQKAPDDGKPLELTPDEQAVSLCRFADRQVTLADFARAFDSFSTFRSIEFDSEGIGAFSVIHLLGQSLLFEAALRDGLDNEPAIARWLGTKRDNMLIEALRRSEVDDRIAASEESIHRYYEENPQRFMKPAEIAVAEILVETREEAEQLSRRIHSGEDIRELAKQHSIREDVVGENGVFHMHPYERVVFGEMLDEAEQAQVGELRGPIEVDEGFSLFRVVEKIPPQPDSFERARDRAEFWVKDQQEWQYFGELLSKLRQKYAGEVVMYEDRMHKVEI